MEAQKNQPNRKQPSPPDLQEFLDANWKEIKELRDDLNWEVKRVLANHFKRSANWLGKGEMQRDVAVRDLAKELFAYTVALINEEPIASVVWRKYYEPEMDKIKNAPK